MRGGIGDTAGFYDRIASDFSRLRGKKPWKPLVTFVVTHLAAGRIDGGVILDIGCGNGRNAAAFLHHGRGTRHVGIDVSTSQLGAARTVLDGEPRAHLVAASATNLPFRDGASRCVACIATLHHLPDRATMSLAVAGVCSALAPGGVLVLSTWRKWQRRFVKALLKNYLMFRRPAGLVNVPWTESTTGQVLDRWYHLPSRRALVALLQPAFTVNHVVPLGGPGGKDNWFVLATTAPGVYS